MEPVGLRIALRVWVAVVLAFAFVPIVIMACYLLFARSLGAFREI